MQVDDIRRLVKLVEESDIDELEVRRFWTVVRIQKRNGKEPGEKTLVVTAPAVPAPVIAAPAAAVPAPAPAPAPAPEREAAPAPSGAPAPSSGAAAPAAGLLQIRSPMVGTFYRSPSPEAPAYVQVGTRVTGKQVVCIVEAMKLMNEIEADVSGVIAEIAVENGQPVEYNQTLFLVRPD